MQDAVGGLDDAARDERFAVGGYAADVGGRDVLVGRGEGLRFFGDDGEGAGGVAWGGGGGVARGGEGWGAGVGVVAVWAGHCGGEMDVRVAALVLLYNGGAVVMVALD